MSRSLIVLLILVSPLVSVLVGLLSDVDSRQQPWLVLLGALSMLHALLFMPIMSGIFAAFICRYEHQGGGWKQLLVLPVTRSGVFLAKYTVIIALLLIMQVLFLGALLLVGAVKGLPGPIPWTEIGRSLLGGWPFLATLPAGTMEGGGFGALNLPFESLMITVVGSFVVFFLIGWVYFRMKEV
ncbi:hypothetical protein BGX30_012711 [Mortierella sp. GBA39]|nr:hypothetical protein BGX30_012711 [Mortierella sp. GBA39]